LFHRVTRHEKGNDYVRLYVIK